MLLFSTQLERPLPNIILFTTLLFEVKNGKYIHIYDINLVTKYLNTQTFFSNDPCYYICKIHITETY